MNVDCHYLFNTPHSRRHKSIDVFFSLFSLVKLHYFQLAFLENCVHKKQKESILYQRNFCSKTIFKVFANSVSAHFKIWCLRFSYKQNDIIFFIPWPRLAIFLKLKIFLYLTTAMECSSFQISNINLFFLSTSKCQSMVNH